MNRATLQHLCTRIAAGDEQAREGFERQIPPLVEIVVRRWLKHQPTAATGDQSPPTSSTPELANHLTTECCTRMIGACRQTRGGDDPRLEDTAVAGLRNDTARWHAKVTAG